MGAEGVGAIIQGANDLGGNIIKSASLANDMSQNIKNMRYQNYAQLLNLALQKSQWDREDTAVQRRVADLKAAGLSPVLAAGSAATSSEPIRIEPQKSNFQMGDWPKISSGEAIMQAMVAESNIEKINQETMKLKQQRYQDYISFPDRLDQMRAQTGNMYQDIQKKALDNYYYKTTGISPTNGSEGGKTLSDLAKVFMQSRYGKWFSELDRYTGREEGDPYKQDKSGR